MDTVHRIAGVRRWAGETDWGPSRGGREEAPAENSKPKQCLSPLQTGSGRPCRGSPRRCPSPQKAPPATFHSRAHRTAPHPWAAAQRRLPSLHRRTGAPAAAAGARTMMCACATARRTCWPPRSWSPTWRAAPPACAASCSFATPPPAAPSCRSCATR